MQEQKKPLVSILTPVYNGARFLDRFFDTILTQTYPNIELILVDDGSCDGSFEKASAFSDAFLQRGYLLRCFRIEHEGCSSAINKALSEFTGEYLKWMDCDDLLMPSCISEEMDYLLSHPECGFVICDSDYVEEGTFKEIRRFGRVIDKEDDYFKDILKGTLNYSLGAGTILISRDNFQRAIPEMQIFVSPEGQNYQLMLPLTYHYTCGYLRKPLFIRVVRKDSHSHMERSYEEQKKRYHNFIILLKETIRRMRIPEQDMAVGLAEKRFGHMLFNLAFENRDLIELNWCRKLLESSNDLGRKELLKWIIAGNALSYRLFRFISVKLKG